MADEKARDRNQDQEKGKAMGAGATSNYQGQQPGDQQAGRGSKPAETAGQGGGIQGTGQSQANPGGFTQGSETARDQSKRDNPVSEEKKERE